MFVELSSALCDLAGVLLVGDIAVSIASGTGFLAVEVGGAEATTGELVLGNPFGAPVAPTLVGGAPAGGGAGGPAAGGVVPGGAGTPPGAAPGAAPAAPRPVASIGPLESLCETVHPSADTSCSEGALLPLGLIGLAATVGMGALDLRQQRRRPGASAPAGAMA
jgi:hypothetical protein